MREICKFYHPAFDIDHNCIDTCRMPEMRPKGASWSDCNEHECPFIAKDNEGIKHELGRWIPGREIARAHLVDDSVEIEYEDYSCSSCGFKIDRCLYHLDGSLVYRFCPNCGADMRGNDG